MNMHISGDRRNTSHVPTAGMANVKRQQKYYADCLDSNLEGFIHHPSAFPLTWRRIRWKRKNYNTPMEHQANIGLCFECEKYIKPGTLLELEITLRGEIQKFSGRVILVKNKGENFEIGVWLTSKEDASRIRIVEQICHIEAYLKLKRHYEGPFVSPDRVAQEWISRFASSFPSFI
jgi:hypothetical protein